MKFLLLLFCLVFVCCYQEFQDNVVYNDIDVVGEYILSNGGQDIILAEKCYYYGKGEYECGLTAVGVVGLVDCMVVGDFSWGGHVDRYRMGPMDFSKVIVKTQEDSVHGIMSYSSDRMFASGDKNYYTSDLFGKCLSYVSYFDAVDLVQGQNHFKNDLLMMKQDSLGVVEVDITDSEGSKLHLVYQMEQPQITESFIFENGGFYIDPKEIKLLLDYCDFTIDSVFVSDSLLQKCLEDCFFCEGVLPMISRRDWRDFYGVHGFYLERGTVNKEKSHFYDAEQGIESKGLYPYSLSNIGVGNNIVQVPLLNVPYVYYKPR